jgi:hypothetical protein
MGSDKRSEERDRCYLFKKQPQAVFFDGARLLMA